MKVGIHKNNYQNNYQKLKPELNILPNTYTFPSLLRTPTLWTELVSAVGEFAQTVSDLAASDLGKSVSHSLDLLNYYTADEYYCSMRARSRQLGSGERHGPVLFDATDADRRWCLVHMYGCNTHGRMPMQTFAASSSRTSATVLMARLRLKKAIVSDIHNSQIGRCVFLTLYVSRRSPHIRNCAIIGGTTRARRET